jgi:hypothetical protein
VSNLGTERLAAPPFYGSSRWVVAALVLSCREAYRAALGAVTAHAPNDRACPTLAAAAQMPKP